ncbi:MAG: BamA/TamA family outer membrane protein [Bacteroidetes bacterium]|nr:BamA/TamA family outer membrane protein [Bacteroidota bacterium]
MKNLNQLSKCYWHILIIILVYGFHPAYSQAPDHIDTAKVAGVPFISYNRSYGGILGGFASLYFPINRKDTVSPASNTGVAGIYATNGSWFVVGYAMIYFHQDRYRTVGAFGTGDQKFQFFSENYPPTGAFIHYSTMLDFGYGEQLVRTVGRLYTGIDFIYYRVKTEYDTGTGDNAARQYVALGIPLTFDTRNNVMNPESGWYANARFNRFDAAFGSSTEYTKLDLDASRYISRKGGVVWAYKVSLSTALGSVPFGAQTIVGGRVIRGYSTGEYRGDQVYAAQAEYRWNFYKKWGSVFFAGVATPVNKGENWSPDSLLPSAGAGIRYMMIPDIRLNVGFDAAVGKGDFGLYFRIGEAF